MEGSLNTNTWFLCGLKSISCASKLSLFLCRPNVSPTRALVFTPTRLSFATLPFVCGPQPHSIKLWLLFDGSVALFLSLSLSISLPSAIPQFSVASNHFSETANENSAEQKWRGKQFCSLSIVSQNTGCIFFMHTTKAHSPFRLIFISHAFFSKLTWGLLKIAETCY